MISNTSISNVRRAQLLFFWVMVSLLLNIMTPFLGKDERVFDDQPCIFIVTRLLDQKDSMKKTSSTQVRLNPTTIEQNYHGN